MRPRLLFSSTSCPGETSNSLTTPSVGENTFLRTSGNSCPDDSIFSGYGTNIRAEINMAIPTNTAAIIALPRPPTTSSKRAIGNHSHRNGTLSYSKALVIDVSACWVTTSSRANNCWGSNGGSKHSITSAARAGFTFLPDRSSCWLFSLSFSGAFSG